MLDALPMAVLQTPPPLSFLARLGLAFSTFFALLADGAFAARVRGLRSGDAPALPPPMLPAVKPLEAPRVDMSALQLLALFQREGRFVDFIQEDVANYTDAEVGGASRSVHAGCRKVLSMYVPLVAVRSESDGAMVTIAAGFDASEVRLVGNVVGSPPFRGALRHHGWRASDVALPTPPASANPSIIAPAEVELP